MYGGARGGAGRRNRPFAHAIYDQSVRLVERVNAVARDAIRIEHDARHVVGMAAQPDLPDDVGIAIKAERAVDQRASRACTGQIEEDSRRIRDAVLPEFDFIIEFDHHADGVGQHGSPDPHDRRNRCLVTAGC